MLSPTVRRWACLSIILAARIWDRKTNGHDEISALVYVCDERDRPASCRPTSPEQRSRLLYRDFGVTFIVATHSAAIWPIPNSTRSKLTSTRRQGMNPPTSTTRSTRTNVGGSNLRAPRRRDVVPVQGVHIVEEFDLWVLDELVGSELENLRTKVLPVHGAKKASGLCASEAGFLLEHAPKFIVAVDGTNQELLQAMLDEARQEAGKPERLPPWTG